MKKLCGLGRWCVLLGLVGAGCAPATEDDGEAGVDEAVAVSALQQGQDGSDEEMGDAMDEAPAMDRECRFSEIRKNLRETYDTDHDGKLSADERATLREDFGGPVRRAARRHAAREARRTLLHHIYDTDGSGVLEADEREELKADLDARCENRKALLLEKFDADGNAELDDAEWTAARKELAARYAARRAEILEKFDANENGKLDAGERAKALIALHDAIEAKWEALVEEFDANQDGKLDDEEKLALRDALKAKVRGEEKG